jgi:hypothetical protein
MVDLSLRIYHHFHDNLDAFAEKAAVFRAIFRVPDRGSVNPPPLGGPGSGEGHEISKLL